MLWAFVAFPPHPHIGDLCAPLFCAKLATPPADIYLTIHANLENKLAAHALLPKSGRNAQIALSRSAETGLKLIVHYQRGSSHDSEETRDLRGGALSRHHRFTAGPSRGQGRCFGELTRPPDSAKRFWRSGQVCKRAWRPQA